MEEFLYDEFYRVERTHWWFAGMRRIFHQFVAPRLDAAGGTRFLDVGCGTGIFIEELQSSARVFGVDLSQTALAYARKRCPASPLVLGDVTALPFATRSMDVVVALDVIEHLTDDGAGLREIRRVLAPGGVVLLNVPAFPSLWGEKDVANHHHRRYRRRRLCEALQASGFRVERITYTNATLFPAVWLARRIETWRRTSWNAKAEYNPGLFLNSALRYLLDIERIILKRWDLPFGVSLTCLAKPDSVDGEAERYA